MLSAALHGTPPGTVAVSINRINFERIPAGLGLWGCLSNATLTQQKRISNGLGG